MKRFCINCGKVLKNNQRKFCGNSCKCKYFYKKNPEKCGMWAKNHPIPLVNNNCLTCGKKCGRNKYCSDMCKPVRMSIPKEYWGGMARINSKCLICKKTFMLLHIHHKDGNHDNNNKDNLIPLCPTCHGKVHNISDIGLLKMNNDCGIVDRLKELIKILPFQPLFP